MLSAPILLHTVQTHGKSKSPHNLICQLLFLSQCFCILSPIAFQFPIFWCLYILTLVHPPARGSEGWEGLILLPPLLQRVRHRVVGQNKLGQYHL